MTMSSVLHSQCAGKPAITTAQSPKLLTPEKKKYPVPARRLKATLVSRKKRRCTEARFALRNAIQKPIPAAKFASVPPAATSLESNALDHATVVSTPDCAPVISATAPCPSPSCKTSASIADRRLMPQTVTASSFLGETVPDVAAIFACSIIVVYAIFYSETHGWRQKTIGEPRSS